MQDEFIELIGHVIHQCGALEMMVNNAITALVHDSVVSGFVLRQTSFRQHIDLLSKLLCDRSGLAPADIKDLCRELTEISELRNTVAHSPILADKPGGARRIVDLRFEAGGATIKKKLGREELREIVNRTTSAIVDLRERVPSSLDGP